MNTILKNLICAAFVSLLFVGCGKDEKSGGSSSSTGVSTGFNQFNSSTIVTGQAALANFNSWYNSTTEATNPTVGPHFVNRVTIQYPQSNGCSSQPISIFGVTLGSFGACFNIGTTNNVQTFPSQASINVVHSGTNKGANTKLAGIFNGMYGQVVNVEQRGSVFIFSFSTNFVQQGALDIVVVDTSLNSLLSPVYILNNAQRREEKLVNWF